MLEADEAQKAEDFQIIIIFLLYVEEGGCTQGGLTFHTALRQKSRNFFEKTKVNSSEILPLFVTKPFNFNLLQHHLILAVQKEQKK